MGTDCFNFRSLNFLSSSLAEIDCLKKVTIDLILEIIFWTSWILSKPFCVTRLNVWVKQDKCFSLPTVVFTADKILAPLSVTTVTI